jgi:hypothetical protein
MVLFTISTRAAPPNDVQYLSRCDLEQREVSDGDRMLAFQRSAFVPLRLRAAGG